MTQRSFLLVSSDRQWQVIAQKALASLGSVDVADSGEKGLEYLRAGVARQRKYSLVVVDVSIAEDIVTTLKDICTIQRDALVVVAAAVPLWKNVREAFAVGATGYITKSLVLKDLIETFEDELTKTPRPWRGE